MTIASQLSLSPSIRSARTRAARTCLRAARIRAACIVEPLALAQPTHHHWPSSLQPRAHTHATAFLAAATHAFACNRPRTLQLRAFRTRPLLSLQPRAYMHTTSFVGAATRALARGRPCRYLIIIIASACRCGHAPPRTQPPLLLQARGSRSQPQLSSRDPISQPPLVTTLCNHRSQFTTLACSRR